MTAQPIHRPDQSRRDAQSSFVGPATSSDSGHSGYGTQRTVVAVGADSPQATVVAASNEVPPAGDQPASGQVLPDAHASIAAGSIFPADQGALDAQSCTVGGEQQSEDGSAAIKDLSAPKDVASLADPSLALAADVLDDAERTRIANENRLRQLTRTAVDKDGEERGFGLDESHPDVARLAVLVDLLAQVEHKATLNLNRKLREHPLGPWVKVQRGIGEKQAARLLAVVGDPYWHTAEDRPRTVSELWAYCGYHTLPAGQPPCDPHATAASGSDSAGGDPAPPDAHTWNVAARRQKGQRANWSTLAKTRAYLIAESCLKAGGPYREVYDKRKANTADRTHAAPCVRCGPSGKPAQTGSPWSDGHRHADALRITAKTVLRDLWREAKRIHEAVAS